MKKIEFAKRWKHAVNSTTFALYPAGAEVVVADHVAAIAHRDGVLKGDPVDAPDEPVGEAAATKKPAKA